MDITITFKDCTAEDLFDLAAALEGTKFASKVKPKITQSDIEEHPVVTDKLVEAVKSHSSKGSAFEPKWRSNRTQLFSKTQRSRLSAEELIRVMVGYVKNGPINRIGKVETNGDGFIINYTIPTQFNKLGYLLKKVSITNFHGSKEALNELINKVMSEEHVIGRDPDLCQTTVASICSINNVRSE